MYQVAQPFTKADTDMLRNAAIVLVIARVIGFGLTFVSSTYIGIIADAITAAGLYMIAKSMFAIGNAAQFTQAEADNTRKWFITYAIALVVTYIPFIGFIGALVALVAGIGSWFKLNSLFKKLSSIYPSQGQLDSWVFPLYALWWIIAGIAIFLSALIAVTAGISLAFVFIITVIAAAGSMILAGILAYTLYKNSQKLEQIAQTTDFSQITSPIPYQAVGSQAYQPSQPSQPSQPYQPAKPTQPAQQPQELQSGEKTYCDNCGAETGPNDKFCMNCGANLN